MPAKSEQSAGIIFRSKDGKVLLLLRGEGGDYPLHWAFPGGHQEDGETLDDTARREVLEETGFKFDGKLLKVQEYENFTCYLADWSDEPFDVVTCDESNGFVWATPDTIPDPLHPGVLELLRIISADTELAVAQLMRDGVLPSPQQYGNMMLFDLRITGTGVSFRSKNSEHVYRPPEHYLNEESLARVNGLPVIWKHPAKSMLNSEEFAERVIGSIMLPYIKGDEMWGISRVYDKDAIVVMSDKDKPLSTSPGVLIDDSTTIPMENGEHGLIEGKPFLWDHLAVCPYGVWDKGGDPAGVNLTNEDVIMTEAEIKAKADAEAKAKADADELALAAKAKADAEEKEKKDSEDSKLDKILSLCDSTNKRMDAMDKRMDAMEKPDDPVMTADAEKEKEEMEKKDAEEKEKKEMEDKAKADEEPQFSTFQAQAETVYHAFADAAPRQMQGERLLPYRRRLLNPLKKHSADYKNVDLNDIASPAMMALAEKRIFADAATAARNPVDVPIGVLREIKTPDGSGRIHSTFHGSPGACWAPFKYPSRCITQINKDFN